MENLYEVLKNLDSNRENWLFTLLDGADAGEKLLISGGTVCFSSAPDGFLKVHSALLQKEIKPYSDRPFTGSISVIRGRRIFSEKLSGESRMVVCGGGHVSTALIRIAKMLGFSITALEDRQEFAARAKAAGADQVFADGYAEHLAALPPSPDTYYVILTRGHQYDRACLEACLRKPSAYVGMIGSRRKVQMTRDALLAEGFSEKELDRVHAPIGLAIGAETPEEIAVSILAEVIEVKNSRHTGDALSGEVLRALTEQPERGPRAVAEIIRKTGSAPRGVGTRMVVFSDGTTAGTVGGGSGEAAVRERALSMLGRKPEPERFAVMTLEMDQKDAAADGLICGGTLELMIETVGPAEMAETGETPKTRGTPDHKRR